MSRISVKTLTKLTQLLKQSLKRQQQWLDSSYAEQFLSCESAHLKNALRQISGPRVLQLGHVIEQSVVDNIDFPQLILCQQIDELQDQRPTGITAVSDPAFLPFEQSSIASVLLSHVLERHNLPHQVLREAHRVLMPEGHLILTGFNPISLMGLQRLVYRRAAYGGHYYTHKRVNDWLQLLGFEIVASAMFQYAPLSKSPRFNKGLSFLNSMGERWLPMFGGGYIITAKKREVNMTLVGKLRFTKLRRPKFTHAAPAKTALKSKN